MSRYVIRRLGFTLVTMLLVTLAIFLISRSRPAMWRATSSASSPPKNRSRSCGSRWG